MKKAQPSFDGGRLACATSLRPGFAPLLSLLFRASLSLKLDGGILLLPATAGFLFRLDSRIQQSKGNKKISAFTDAEVTYLKSQRLGLLATVGPDGQPHAVPVGFRYNPDEDAIEIGGRGGFSKRKKYRDVVLNPRVAFVVDEN